MFNFSDRGPTYSYNMKHDHKTLINVVLCGRDTHNILIDQENDINIGVKSHNAPRYGLQHHHWISITWTEVYLMRRGMTSTNQTFELDVAIGN